MDEYTRVSANITDSSTSIDSVFVFAIRSPSPDNDAIQSFIVNHTSNLTQMFDPFTGDVNKSFDNPNGIHLKVIGYLKNSFSNIETNFTIEPVQDSDTFYIYTTNGFDFANVVAL